MRGIVGVNKYVVAEPLEIPILEMDPEGEARHLARLERVRRERDNERGGRGACRAARRRAGRREPDASPMLDCVRAYATLGEMCDVLREVFGVYREVAVV